MKNKFFLKFGLVAATLWVFSATAHAQQVLSIVTSFPKDLTAVCKKAFEAKNRGVKVEVPNKNTSTSAACVREAPATNTPDIFWASAPEAVEVPAKDGLLAKYDGKAAAPGFTGG